MKLKLSNTVTLGDVNVRMVIILGDPGTGQREKSRFRPDKLPLGLRGSVIINQPEKKNEKRKLYFINKRPTKIKRRPQKNAWSKLQILIKCRGRLIEKIRYKYTLVHFVAQSLQLSKDP